MPSGGPKTWVLLGATRGILLEAEECVRGLANQTTLALRNSRAHDELARQARVDSLTGLDNRAAFVAKAAEGLGAGADQALHILFLDLDDFKNVNDAYGHRSGDELLIAVAARIRAGVRPGDLCARLGGDEFAVILYGAADLEAVQIAQRLVDSVARPFRLSHGEACIGASVGIAASRQVATVEALIHQADVAMHAAKAGGKGRVHLFDPDRVQAIAG